MGYELICTLYAILLLLYVITLCYLLKNDTISFRTGFLVAVMYFIWPGVVILLATGSLPLLSPFWDTSLKTIHISDSGLLWLWVYLVAILIYVYLSLFTLKKRTLKFDKITSARTINLFYVTTLYVGIMLFFLYISGTFNGGNWYTSRQHLLKTNAISVFMPFLLWSLRFLFIAKVVEIFAARNSKWKGAFLAIIIVALAELLGGSRIFFVMLFLAILLLWLYQKKWTYVSLMGIASIPIAWLAIIYQEIRHAIYLGPDAIMQAINNATGSNLVRQLEKVVLSVTESVDLTVIFTIFEKMGHGIEPLWGSSYAKFLVWIIPRPLWPNKPESITIIAGNAFGYGHLSLVTTVIGEADYNFSWIGPLMLILIILFAEFLSRLVFPYRTLRNRAAMAACGFMFFRMAYSDMAISLLILAVIYVFINSTTKTRYETMIYVDNE